MPLTRSQNQATHRSGLINGKGRRTNKLIASSPVLVQLRLEVPATTHSASPPRNCVEPFLDRRHFAQSDSLLKLKHSKIPVFWRRLFLKSGRAFLHTQLSHPQIRKSSHEVLDRILIWTSVAGRALS